MAAPVRWSDSLGGSHALGGEKTQILPNFELHAVNLRQEPRDRGPIIHRIRLGLPHLGHLLLEPGDTSQSRLQFLVVDNHGPSATISTMPRWPPSRRTCQYSIMACSPPSAPERLVQNTLAPKWASASMCWNTKAASPVTAVKSKGSSISRMTSTSFGSAFAVTNEPNTMNRAKCPVETAS